MSPRALRGIFSLNTFLAGMLALYVALALGLENPFWALMSVYIVSNPLAGTVRSKAIYRLAGTVVGAAVAVVLVPAFSNSPPLLSLALALWVGFCGGSAVLDRTPRSYAFVLCGYTAALVGFPSVDNPGQVFWTAVARVEETGIGILCATILHSLVLPKGIGPSLSGLIRRFEADAQDLVTQMLNSRGEPPASLAYKLAGDVTALYLMATHLPFDVSDYQTKSRETRALAERMSALLPLVRTVGDRLQALRRSGATLPADSEALIRDVSDWVASGPEAPDQTADALLARAHALEPSLGPSPRWDELLAANFHARLGELISTYRECRALGGHLADGTPIPLAAQPRPASTAFGALHLDYGMAFWSGLTSVIAITLVCAFWIMTGWSSGSSAAMLTAVFTTLFAAMDDPAQQIRRDAIMSIAAAMLAGIYLFVILPPLDSFAMLALALFPFLFTTGLVIALPQYARWGYPVLMATLGAMALQGTFRPDFAHFANNVIALVAAPIAALVVTRLVRSVGTEFAARRIIRLAWADIARMTATRRMPTREAWTTRMVDRVGLIGPRLGPESARADMMGGTLQELRIGLSVLDLRQLETASDPSLRRALAILFAHLNRHFQALSRGRRIEPSSVLLRRLDTTIRAAVRSEAGPARTTGLLALTGLRRNLFPQAAAPAGKVQA